MDFLSWLGRFHPAIVHFPLGILVLGVILQFISVRRPNVQMGAAVRTVYLIGFVSALAAAFAGWMLAEEGGYQPDTIFWHRWLGILMVIVSFVLYWMNRKPDSLRSTRWVALALFIGLLYTGHLGGKLTHGKEYLLETAPTFVQKLASYEEGSGHPILPDPDSTYVYEDLIKPFLETKCWTCHDEDLHKGGLVMSVDSLLMEGGRNGAVIESSAGNSELFARVTMDPGRRKYMPPKGTPLSYQEVKLLEWWIDAGSPFDKTVVEVETSEEIKKILMDRHQLDTKPKSFLEKTQVDSVPQSLMNEIAASGFSINRIAMTSNFVDVRWNNADTLSINDAIVQLEKVAEQVAWLDLGNSGIEDQALVSVGKLQNLVRLKLDNSDITDAGIAHLTDLKHLESLNLYSTKITDICASDLEQLTSLKKLFVWQTEFGQEGMDRLQAAIPEIEIVQGYSFAPPAQ